MGCILEVVLADGAELLLSALRAQVFDHDLFWRFTVLKKAYGPDEWGYLTRTALGFSDKKWAMLGAEERARLVRED